MQALYQIPSGNIKVSRVFIGECDCEDAVEEAVLTASETDGDLTARHNSGIIQVQNVCSPADRKESRL